ncbi:hypothetical protein O5833_27660, partial [Escherichia coli]|nr:hypothetical protein [Escherichia coli]
ALLPQLSIKHVIRFQLKNTGCGVIGAEGALELFLGNAGTAMRPLAAALCLGSNDIVLTGEPRMKQGRSCRLCSTRYCSHYWRNIWRRPK